MERISILPKDRADWLRIRSADITSTEVSALFGLNPRMTSFELYHRKRDASLVDDDANEYAVWGLRLQDAIAAGVAQDHEWDIRPFKEYVRIPELRAGSSFDFRIGVPEALLEIKNVFGMTFRDSWVVENGSVEAPPEIELQIQHQLLLSNLAKAFIAALVGGNQIVILEREPDAKIQARIVKEVGLFWERIAEGKPPTPDFTRDTDFLARLYRVQPGKVLDAKGDAHVAELVERYTHAMQVEKSARATKDAVKGHLLSLMGDAEKAIGEGFTVNAKQIAPTRVEAYDRAGYRDFRINVKANGGQK